MVFVANRHDKRDANEAEVIKALRGAGCSVARLQGHNGIPDLLVGRAGFNLLLEVKLPTGRLTGAQVEWHRNWAGQVTTVFSVEDALEAVGLVQ